MPLVSCPECRETISDRARSCPKCGFPIRIWTQSLAKVVVGAVCVVVGVMLLVGVALLCLAASVIIDAELADGVWWDALRRSIVGALLGGGALGAFAVAVRPWALVFKETLYSGWEASFLLIGLLCGAFVAPIYVVLATLVMLGLDWSFWASMALVSPVLLSLGWILRDKTEAPAPQAADTNGEEQEARE